MTNADAALRHLTVAGNSTQGGGGGLQLEGSGSTVTLDSCLVAENLTPLPIHGPDIHNDAADLVTNDTNLVGNNTTVSNTFPAGPLLGVAGAPLDPLLGTIGSNGGSTRTRPLLAGSPAIDAGVSNDLTPLTDQRQHQRIRGSAPDLGAYETGNDAGYTLWALEHIPSASDDSFDGDVELDGIKNGWEYGVRLGPLQSNDFPFVISNSGTGVVSLEFPFRSTANDLVYIVESTDELLLPFNEVFRLDLSGFSTTNSATGSEVDIDVGAETISYSQNLDSIPPVHFWRLSLQQLITP